MKIAIRIIAAITIALGTAQAGQSLEIVLRTSDIRSEPDSERLASIAVTLPTNLRGLRIDFATLEFWIEPSNEAADTIPFLVSVVPLENDGGRSVEVEGRWASAVVADPRSPRRIVLDATAMLRHWMESPTVDPMLAIKVSQRQLIKTPSVSTSRLGNGIVARLRVYATHQFRPERVTEGQ